MRFARRGSPSHWYELALFVGLAVLVALPALPAPFSLDRATAVRTAPASSGTPGRFPVAPAFVPGPGVEALGAVPATTSVEVAVALANANSSAIAAQLALIDTPGTPEFRHFLTAAEVADQYAVTPATYDAAAAEFRAAGLHVQTSPDRQMLLVSGPAPTVAAAFDTSFETYRSAGRTFFSHPTPASLPGGLPWAGAIGLGNVTPIRPAAEPVSAAVTPAAACAGSGGNGFTPCQIEKGYNFSGLIAAGDNGTGETLAVVDAYDGSETQPQLASDLKSFETATGTPAGTVDYLYPVPTSNNLNLTSTGWGLEEALDLEWARAIAPAATTKMTFAPDATAGLYASVDWLVAHEAADVISLSWGENDVGVYNAYNGACASGCNATTDGSLALLHPVFEAAALEGITVLSATGDCGAAAGTSGDSTDYPSSDAYVVAVGGTDLSLTSADAWSSETAWSGNASGASAPGCQNQGGSGGGYSPYPRPYWQVATGFPTNQTHRGTPDVSADAGNPVAVVIGGLETSVGGTSAACPMWGGFVTDLDSYVGANLGFVTPSLYAAASGPNGSRAFHDITSGSNGYRAGTGWDPVTGLGTPNGGVLAPLVARTHPVPPAIDVNLTATPRFGTAPLTVTFDVDATGGVRPYSLEDVSFGDYNSSFASNGTVRHAYPHDGAYSAWAIVYDAEGNASISEPVEVVVGGHALNVTIRASLTRSTVHQAVQFTANVSGGLAPYTYNWSFGDGTFLHNGTTAVVNHSYGWVGGFCATVAVHDSATPQDGAVSNRSLQLVGAATTGFCPTVATLAVAGHAAPLAWDLPGDLNLTPTISGGTAPYTVQYVSDDPYVADCECGIFRTPGNHTVTVFVNDSGSQEANATLNVTLYPALTGVFSVNATSGPGPLSVRFDATISGGHGTNVTNWTFGDGATATGNEVNHTYATEGFYLAVGHANDSFGGNASEAFLIDVTGPAASGPTVTATISPAVRVTVGTETTFSASATGGSAGPYLFNWSFAPVGLSAFGATVGESVPYLACLATGSCPLRANLTVSAANGTLVETVPIVLDPYGAGNFSALAFATQLTPLSGSAPFVVFGTASATGVDRPSVSWRYGDGGGGSGLSVQHTYTADGNFTAEATATDVAGEQLVHTYAVLGAGPGPANVVVSGGANETAGIAPLPVSYSVNASGGTGPPYNYTWAFGNGGVGYGPDPNVTYTEAGTYYAVVTARDPRGAHGSIELDITAYNTTTTNLTATLAPNVTTPSSPVALAVAAVADCDGGAAPGCSNANVTVRAYLAPASPAPNQAPPVAVTGPISLAPDGFGAATFDAPSTSGSYLLTVQTVGRNYTGLVAQYLVVNATAPAPPPDRTMWLIGGSVAAGVAVGLVAVVVERRRRPPEGNAVPPEPPAQ